MRCPATAVTLLACLLAAATKSNTGGDQPAVNTQPIHYAQGCVLPLPLTRPRDNPRNLPVCGPPSPHQGPLTGAAEEPPDMGASLVLVAALVWWGASKMIG